MLRAPQENHRCVAVRFSHGHGRLEMIARAYTIRILPTIRARQARSGSVLVSQEGDRDDEAATRMGISSILR
jgi:hypothetical protein